MFLVSVLEDEAELCLVPALGIVDLPCGDYVEELDE